LSARAVPKEPLGKIFSSADYPRSALEGRDQGSVETVMLIDEAGKIRDCSVETSSEIPMLDTMFPRRGPISRPQSGNRDSR
jgi:outer membrane biosynthesis protein TonB